MANTDRKKTIRVSNLLPHCRQIQKELQGISESKLMEADSTTIIQSRVIINLAAKISRKVARLKKSLKSRASSPSHLPLPSYRAFLWLAFLADSTHLSQHLQALTEFQRMADEILSDDIRFNQFFNRTFELNLFYLPYIYQTKTDKRQVRIAVHEAMISAPQDIKRDLLLAALKNRKPALKNLRSYCSSPAYYKTEAIIRGGHAAQGSSPQGKTIDLIEVFEKVNREYFHARLEQPQICWSTRKSYRRLGTYSAQLDQVTISRALDSADHPAYLIEFIMYHELLHKHLGVQRANSGKHNHTKSFKEYEMNFRFYEEATEYMKTLGRVRRKNASIFRFGR